MKTFQQEKKDIRQRAEEHDAGLPWEIKGAAVWYGELLSNDTSWIHYFSDMEIEELLAAVQSVRNRGLKLERVGREEFPLPTLGSTLDRIRGELINGRGFILFRGFPLAHTSRYEISCAFWGVSQYLGTTVPQNAEGHLIGHVTDLGADLSDPDSRVYATNQYHRFHTDSVDIVGLLCLQKAKEGGVSSVVSSVTIYNEMLVSHPKLVDVLFKPFPVSRKGEVPPGEDAFYCMPIFHYHEGLLSAIFSRDFINASQHHSDAPRLTKIQNEAMDVLERMAADPRLRLDMQLEPGDMQFLHNHQILHSRSAYEDYPEPDLKRHLLRIWLCPPDGRVLPEIFAKRYGSVEIGNRGGIRVSGVAPSIPVSVVPTPWWMAKAKS